MQAQKVGASFLKNWVQKNGATTLAGTEDVFTPWKKARNISLGWKCYQTVSQLSGKWLGGRFGV